MTLVTALAISAVAIYYSVAGLAAIFAAAVIPIIIMGTVLEVSKLVTAVWLHRYWHRATWWLKTYLTAAVVILMFITSMGIFGFLSNAHVQQTAQGESATAQLERIESEIARQEATISRAEDKIESAQSEGVGGDSNIQAQIDREQERIDRAYARAEPAIQEQRDIIDRQEGRIEQDIADIESEIDRLDSAVSNGEIETAQHIIGAEADGIMGPNTRDAIEDYRDRKAEEKDQLDARLDEVANDPRVQSAQEEIARIRERVENQVAESNELINRLRSQLGTSTGEDIDAVIDEQNTRISTASNKIDSLTEEKFQIEAEYRKLEAEVGPIKYIAEFVYGEEADQNLLEEAVRWVIVIIIFVFDPLAVLLLIASQYTFRWHGRELFAGENPGSSSPPPATDPGPPRDSQPEIELPEAAEYDLSVEEAAEPYIAEDKNANYNNTQPTIESEIADPVQTETEKKDIESWEELDDRKAIVEQLDDDVHWDNAKKLWKEDHPNKTIKEQKLLYINGVIDNLPWEDYLSDNSEKSKKKILSNEREQPTDSQANRQITSASYVQNGEQTESSIWKQIYDRE
jgi:cell division protein FtsB